jgi:drug/metabolite transporter (DMT)-like permease
VYNCVFGALWLLPYVVWHGRMFEWGGVAPLTWWALAFTIVPTTIFGFVAWNWGLRRVGPVIGTNLFYLMPVTAALAAWWLLGEPVTTGKILGGVVIISGVVVLRWDTMVSAGIVRGLPEGRLWELVRRKRT